MSKVLNNLINKKVKIYYNDTNNTVTQQTGVIKDYDEDYVFMKDYKGKQAIIPRDNIVRIEPYER